MGAGSFIASNIRFKGKMAVIPTAVSFFAVVFSLMVAAGYRGEFRTRLSRMTGDVQLTSRHSGTDMAGESVRVRPGLVEGISEIRGIERVEPVIYRAGIVRKDDRIQGVMFKGVPSEGGVSLGASIPSGLAKSLGLSPGDDLPGYFVGDRLAVRKFRVTDVYEGMTGSGQQMVFVGLEDLRRVNLWDDDRASALEITLGPRYSSRDRQKAKAVEIAGRAYSLAEDDDDPVVAVAASDRYYNLFDWLDLVDMNVLTILLLMILVAGFNMVSGLLILLFRNISTIGTLKAVGMSDRGVAGVFLRVAAKGVFAGMLAGNVIALALGLLQKYTHFIGLNPDNYFLSFVPVSIDLPRILAVDALAFVAIMVLLVLPSLFIAKVDPADTMRVR